MGRRRIFLLDPTSPWRCATKCEMFFYLRLTRWKSGAEQTRRVYGWGFIWQTYVFRAFVQDHSLIKCHRKRIYDKTSVFRLLN